VTTTAIRLTAAERREAVLDAAMAEFAARYVELLPRSTPARPAASDRSRRRSARPRPFGPQGSRRVGQSAYPLGVKVSDRELAAVRCANTTGTASGTTPCSLPPHSQYGNQPCRAGTPNRPHLGGIADPLRPRLPRRWPADSDATQPDDGADPRGYLAAWATLTSNGRLGQHLINCRTRGLLEREQVTPRV
jgi:hypothetical protein